MTDERSYTLEEIERETGFDKRTIAYYVQEGLLPKVGRRGPRTRYPQSYLDRLMFIREIRNHQDRGRLASLTLSDIGDILSYLTEEEIADVVSQRETLDLSAFEPGADRPLPTMAPPDHRMDRLRQSHASFSSADAPNVELIESIKGGSLHTDGDSTIMIELDDSPPVLELREVTDDHVPEISSPRPPADRSPPRREGMGAMLEHLAARTGRRSGRRGSEHWTRANVTADITVSARDVDEEGAELLEAVARSLRWKLLRSRRRSRE
jgi:DNA-binding transcriptional MerR regulator